MNGISGSSSYGGYAYGNSMMPSELDGVQSGSGSRSASERAEEVAELTFQESLKSKMISGLYAAAKEIRS
jgi:hypothetical protein